MFIQWSCQIWFSSVTEVAWELVENFYLIWAFNFTNFSGVCKKKKKFVASNYFFSWWCLFICKCVSGNVWTLAFWKMALFATQRSFLNVKHHLVVVHVSCFLMSERIFFSRFVFEVNLVFWGSGKFWFSETIGYEKNIEHCHKWKIKFLCGSVLTFTSD